MTNSERTRPRASPAATTSLVPEQPLAALPEAPFYVAARLLDQIATRLAELEARVARIEGERAVTAADPTLDSAEAARFLGFSIHGFYRILKRDPELVKCYFRVPGKRSHMKFSRDALEKYKAARRT